MIRIRSEARVNDPVEESFEYMTTPGNWPEWHPSSSGVSGATDHSLEPGGQVTEEYRVAGRRVRITWTVRERVAPSRWVIEGRTAEGGGGKITHTLAPREGGTAFERELVYTMPSALLAQLDGQVSCRRVEAGPAEALRRLRGALERRAAWNR